MPEDSRHLTDPELTAAAEQARQIAADARSDERLEQLARTEADAAAQLQENAETLRGTAEELRETQERVKRIAADTRELAADVRAAREDASRVRDTVRETPPIVEPSTGE